MTALRERICHHERLTPTEWNQIKPEPCVMVSHTDPWGKISWCCPICDWGWDSPCEALEVATRIIERAAQTVFGKGDINTND